MAEVERHRYIGHRYGSCEHLADMKEFSKHWIENSTLAVACLFLLIVPVLLLHILLLDVTCPEALCVRLLAEVHDSHHPPSADNCPMVSGHSEYRDGTERQPGPSKSRWEAGSEYVNSFNGQYNIVICLYAHISNTNGCMNFTLSSRQEHFGYFR